MQHLWSIATWDQIVTHDAGRAEWLETPVMYLDISDLAPDSRIYYDEDYWTIELSRVLYLLSAWQLDERHDGVYFTCIDPRGITLHQEVRDAGQFGQLPTFYISSIPLRRIWYTGEGIYTFTVALMNDELPFQQLAAVRIHISYKEAHNG